MVRDRLIEMQQLAGIEEGRPLKNEQKEELKANRPKESFEQFMSEVDEIRHVMMVLSVDRETIRSEQAASLASGASDSAISRQLNDRVDRFIAQARKIHQKLAAANDDLKNFPESGYGYGRARHEQIRVLKMSFETIMLKFNEEQAEYKDRAAQKIAEYLRKQNIEVSDDQINDAIETGSLFQLTRNVHLGVVQKKALFEDVKSRATDIMIVEKQIREIADLFVDMQNMVTFQGESIERIETSVSNAQEYTATGNRNVKEAVVLRRRGRKWKIIILIVGMFLILVVLGLIKWVTPFL